MSLVFVESFRADQSNARIVKQGYVNFRKSVLAEFGISKGQRYRIAYDNNDDEINTIYFIKDEKRGSKVIVNEYFTHSICLSKFISQTKLKIPVSGCLQKLTEPIEIYNNIRIIPEGFKIKLIKE